MKAPAVLKALFKNTGGFSQRVIRSGFWVGASFAVGKILSTIQQIVLARLLLPSDFGLLGIALLAMGTLDVFTQTGLEVALLRRRHIDEEVLNTGWTLLLSRAFVLTALLLVSGPYVADFFRAPHAAPLLQTLAITFFIEALSNIGMLQFRRDLDFRQHVILGQSYHISNLILSVSLALIYRSVWAIIIARLISCTVRTLLSYRICSYRPRLVMNRTVAGELLGFGKHVFMGHIILFLIMNGDDALVGRLLGTTALGFYTLAYALSNTPTTSVTYVISRVALPAYGKLQDNIPALKEGYHKALKFTATLGLPLSAGLLTLAPDIVRSVYGEKWMPMVAAVQILTVFGAIRALAATTGPLFHAIGRPGLVTRLAGVQLVLTALLIYPLIRQYGIWGAGLSVTLGSLVANTITAYMAARTLGDRLQKLLALLLPPLLASGMMSLFLVLARITLNLHVSLSGLILLILLGGGMYALFLFILDKSLWQELRALFRMATAEN